MMRPIFKLEITKNNNTILKIDNISTPLDFTINCTRALNFDVGVNEITFNHFPTPFLQDKVLLHRAFEDIQIITIQAGYLVGTTQHLYPLTTGQVANYWGGYEQSQDYFKIQFIENTIQGNLYYDFLLNTFLKNPLYKMTWKNAIKSVFGDMVDDDSLSYLTSSTIVKSYARSNYYDFLCKMTRDEGILWYFSNNKLYLSDPLNIKKWFDLSEPYQIKIPCNLEENNPFLILDNINPIHKATRIWGIQTVFNPHIIPSVGVVGVDKYYNKKKGLVSRVVYSINHQTASNLITFVEVMNE